MGETMSRAIQSVTYEKGELRIAGGTERYILIPLRAYAAIIEGMRKLVGEGAGGALYFVGRMIGRGLVEEILRRMDEKSLERNVENVIKTYVQFLEELGFGKIEILEIGTDHAKIKMYSPPSMVGLKIIVGEIKAVGGHVCHLERGMIAAVFEEVLKRPYRGVEVEHGTYEDPYCTIVVEPAR